MRPFPENFVLYKLSCFAGPVRFIVERVCGKEGNVMIAKISIMKFVNCSNEDYSLFYVATELLILQLRFNNEIYLTKLCRTG